MADINNLWRKRFIIEVFSGFPDAFAFVCSFEICGADFLFGKQEVTAAEFYVAIDGTVLVIKL